MLALHSPDPDLLSRLERALQTGRDPWTTSDPEVFLEPPSGISCAVVGASSPSPSFFDRLRRWQRQEPDVPVVLVLPRTDPAVRGLKDVVVQELVWRRQVEEELEPAIMRALRRRFFHVAAREVQEAPGLPEPLAEALSLALRRDPPPTSVQGLAARVGKDRRTLWHHWKNVTGPDGELTLKGFLDWVLLLRAASLKSAERSWASVARELDVHVRTLRRAAKRRLGVRLRPLAGGEGMRAFGTFRSSVLPRVMQN